ncbi:thaumatin [Parasitella parasitica]|nr:thaumatin [Parasitella parasitica]
MYFFSSFYFITAISVVSSIPSLKGTSITTIVKLVNQCDSAIHVGQLGDTILNSGNVINIAPGSSKKYRFEGQWSGRFWAREVCEANVCQIAGAAFPASLAEFTFRASGDKDYYDISFVDGYNLPIRIDPIQANTTAQKGSESGKYWCGTPTCDTVPQCPSELQVKSADGAYIGCLSACSKFETPEYCCTEANNTPDTCLINDYAASVKKACPDVYSYAYDDVSSLYECRASGYTITWCPK